MGFRLAYKEGVVLFWTREWHGLSSCIQRGVVMFWTREWHGIFVYFADWALENGSLDLQCSELGPTFEVGCWIWRTVRRICFIASWTTTSRLAVGFGKDSLDLHCCESGYDFMVKQADLEDVLLDLHCCEPGYDF